MATPYVLPLGQTLPATSGGTPNWQKIMDPVAAPTRGTYNIRFVNLDATIKRIWLAFSAAGSTGAGAGAAAPGTADIEIANLPLEGSGFEEFFPFTLQAGVRVWAASDLGNVNIRIQGSEF